MTTAPADDFEAVHQGVFNGARDQTIRDRRLPENSSPKPAAPEPIGLHSTNSVSRQLLDEGTRQILVKQNAHGPEWSRGPNPEQRAPVSSKPTGTDPRTARSFHLLPGSRRATELEPVCHGRPVYLQKSLDRCARPNVIRPACDHDQTSLHRNSLQRGLEPRN